MKRLAANLAIPALLIAAHARPIPGQGVADAAGRSPCAEDPAAQARVTGLLDELRVAGKAALADQLKARFERSARDMAARPDCHTIFGRVAVIGSDEVEKVDAQMRILDGGYFVATVARAGSPVGFRLQGYQPVDILPAGEPGSVEDVGLVVLAPLPESSKASILGKVALENRADSSAASARLSIQTGPINNPTGGYEGSRGIPIPPIPIPPGGELAATGLVPTRHILNVRAPGYWVVSRTVDLQPGQPLDVGTVALELGDRVTVTTMVARGPSFADATPTTQTVPGPDGWRVMDGDRDTGFLLLLSRPDGREVRVRSSHGPFELADLGEGAIEDLAKRDHSAVRLSNATLPARSGHVYLGRWGFAGAWVLFRIETRKLTDQEARELGPERP